MPYNNKQNGSQPPEPSTSKNVANNTDKQEICRDYIWGNCKKGSNCRYRHEFDHEYMKKTLKFCHDYQNRTSCTREGCNYLHASKEEQKLFISSGVLPRVLVERYANMAQSTAETIPQIAMYIQESLGGPPPAVPVASTQPVPATIGPAPAPVMTVGHMPTQMMPMGPMPPPGVGMGPMPPVSMGMGPVYPAMMSMPGPVMTPAPPPMMPVPQVLPPPPPPPTQPAVVAQPAPPVYTAPPPPPTTFTPPQRPPPVPPEFDASKPPPQVTQNGTVKRSSPLKNEAGPSKVRKEEDTNHNEPMCEYCQQRRIRLDLYKNEIEKITAREEFQVILYKKKMEELQKRKDILKTLVNSDVFKIIEEYIEEGVTLPDSTSQNITNDSNLLLQVLDYFRGPSLSTSRLDDSLRSLVTRSSPQNSPTSDSLFSIVELVCNVNNSDREDRTKEAKNGNNNGNNNGAPQNQIAATSRGQSTTLSMPGPSRAPYPAYSMPPMIQPYNNHQPLRMAAAAGNSMIYGVNGVQNGPQQAGGSMPKPPTSTSQSNSSQNAQNSAPFPPPTPYYNPFQ